MSAFDVRNSLFVDGAILHARLRGYAPDPDVEPPTLLYPGDIATFTAWWGLRAYSAAVAATGTQNAVRIRRASDNAETDIVILTTGDLDIASATTFIGASTAFVTKIYDQTNGLAGAGGTSMDLVQATVGRQPQLFLTGGGGSGTKPYLSKNAGNNGVMAGANVFTPNASLSMSLAIVANRVTTSTARFMTSNDGAGTDGIGMWTDGANSNQWQLRGCGVAATDNVWHAGNGRLSNDVVGGTTFNVDGVEQTSISSIGAAVGAPRILDPQGVDATVMLFGEGGFKDNALWDAGIRTALYENMRDYWGTP